MNEIQLFDDKKIAILKNMYFKGLDDDNLQVFLHACKRTNLDPFMRQIYAVMRADYQTGKQVMTIQTGIDGYRLIAERTGKYSPGREPVYSYDKDGRIISSTAFVKKMTDDGSWHEVAATAFFSEYCQKKKSGEPTQFWVKMGHTMIAKCAEALALRKAFPADLSGIYTKEEMQQAEVEEVQNEVIASGNTMLGNLVGCQLTPEMESLTVQLEKERIEKEDHEEFMSFISQYPEENADDMGIFFATLKDAWQKPRAYVINKYRDHEKFMVDFGKWKVKHGKTTNV